MKTDEKKIKLLLAVGLVFDAIILLLFFVILPYFHNKNNQKETPPAKVETTVAKPAPVENSYSLVIEKINIIVPIIINVDGNDKDTYDKSLEGGVAHLIGTALPGKTGNTFIFGHSSFYAWKPGNFKDVFKDLNYLENEDQIVINSNLSRYVYKIVDKQIVLPDQVEVANQNYSEQKLTLMTCWPVGSDAKRLVIVAQLSETVPIQ